METGNLIAPRMVMVDGNEAAARIAYLTNEVIAIYPITPASPMGEWADAWGAAGRTNLWETVPVVMEMQSEGGAAGVVHGALLTGALTTTFTASQGLLLMIPNMYKIAGELIPTVFHVAARTVATHALSIFGDHSDVMAIRPCGWAMLVASTVQEVQDLALIAQAATLRARVPFVHFFDGFRTSHELNKIAEVSSSDISSLLDPTAIAAHRNRGLDPEHPTLRGSAQNPDVYFQAREACNVYYDQTPSIVQEVMDQFAQCTGRNYHPFEYAGAPDAERVIVLMGSGIGAVQAAVDQLVRGGEKVGLVKVRLYRPFDAVRFVAALPHTVRRMAVLDRTKEPGALGEPLYLDVVAALAELRPQALQSERGHHVTAGRYGLSSKEFTPAMALAIFADLASHTPRRHFTVGIQDDVTHLSLPWQRDAYHEPSDFHQAVFYGLGSDGTVGATKNSVKIIGENTPLYAQGYFVYDSKKAGSTTVSHLRFGPRPIDASYLVEHADFVACHQFQFLDRIDVLQVARHGACFLLNSHFSAAEVWEYLPREVQQQLIDKQIRFYVIDAHAISAEAGLGGRINTVMQTCFFALSEILPKSVAIEQIKQSISKTYQKKGETVLRRNHRAVDASLAGLQPVPIPPAATSARRRLPPVPDTAPDFVQKVIGTIIAGQGDYLPVSAFPVDGTFPTATSQYEKRSIAASIPIWDPSLCIECGLCALVCPHAAIRTKVYALDPLMDSQPAIPFRPYRGSELEAGRLTVQVAPDDCTGCGVCVDICPARSKEVARHKAINMEPWRDHVDRERQHFATFLQLPELDRRIVHSDTIKGSQLLQPLFEYSGACAGCGETPYLKLLTQLFGDRLLVANATGCSSIYGGNLPTTPWSVNAAGRGPAWANSLFEDNGEFGLGMRLALNHKQAQANHWLQSLGHALDPSLVEACLHAPQSTEAEIDQQRERVTQLRRQLAQLNTPAARQLESLLDCLVRRSVWIVGGDGWAYDIGFGGLDHVLASGHNVNVLVLDTGVYSNTGGQSSKATPRAATAKFAANGKSGKKKDLGMLAVAYGHVYVAQIALAANPAHTLRTFHEAESYDGPSLILAYSQCIAHGIDMTTGMSHQKDVVRSGFWPLYHYDPRLAHDGEQAFHLDSRKPSLPFREFAATEARFALLGHADAERAETLLTLAQSDIDDQWHYYEQMAALQRDVPQRRSNKEHAS